MNDHESEALWRLFGGERDGVAIRTRYAELVRLMNEDDGLFVGCVRYIDYEKEWFPDGNVFYPLMHKRRAFAHEHEVRLVKMNYESFASGNLAGPVSLGIPISVERLIEGIFVNPNCQEWYVDAVKAVVAKLAPDLAGRVAWSSMKGAPLY